ncbi:hypothetical protein FSP39_003327 [Pinctada imbricata]|uniref:Transmembrane protein 246 n=1 Tax=Pinctada imbricata TaxID=66713 RepID=A0AA88Y8Y8_PINIB|nr:hypothetical protein FSP39_003327 [Pinctada imbricata]
MYVFYLQHYVQMETRLRFLIHLLCLIAVTFLVVLPVFSFKLKFSIYYPLWPRNKVLKQTEMRKENDDRLKEAETYLSQVRTKQSRFGEPSGPVDLVICIITVSRNRHVFDSYEPKYLTQVVSRFSYLLENAGKLRYSYHLSVCDVDDDPQSYREAQKLSRTFDVFHRFPIRNSSRPFNRPYRTIDDTLEKEKQDYIFCGEEALKRNASNVFLVEDDALPHDDVISVVEYILQNYIKSNFGSVTRKQEVAYFKFYHPDRLLGYISLEAERLPELVSISVLLATAMTSLYLKLRPKAVSYKTLVWIGFLIYSSLLFIFIGRQTFIELRRISRNLYQVTPAPSCCTPAMLYTKNGFIKISEHLKSVRCKNRYGKDTALDEFRTKSGLIARMVQPNLFTHIGMYSSLRDQVLDPFIV